MAAPKRSCKNLSLCTMPTRPGVLRTSSRLPLATSTPALARTVHKGPRRELRNWDVRLRLLLLVIIPAVAVTVVAVCVVSIADILQGAPIHSQSSSVRDRAVLAGARGRRCVDRRLGAGVVGHDRRGQVRAAAAGHTAGPGRGTQAGDWAARCSPPHQREQWRERAVRRGTHRCGFLRRDRRNWAGLRPDVQGNVAVGRERGGTARESQCDVREPVPSQPVPRGTPDPPHREP